MVGDSALSYAEIRWWVTRPVPDAEIRSHLFVGHQLHNCQNGRKELLCNFKINNLSISPQVCITVTLYTNKRRPRCTNQVLIGRFPLLYSVSLRLLSLTPCFTLCCRSLITPTTRESSANSAASRKCSSYAVCVLTRYGTHATRKELIVVMDTQRADCCHGYTKS